jgi:2-hydroxychromene-2-carboxylate isomerase
MIHFYFDFSSPYSYIAAQWLPKLAADHARALVWHPILLGAIFKEVGNQSPVSYKLKDSYSVMDFARSARFEGVDYSHPTPFPVASQNAARIFLWLQGSHPERALSWAQTVWRAYFVQGENISETATLRNMAQTFGLEGTEAQEVIADDTIKALLKQSNEAALEQGVFGAPFFIVDGEKFWGNDRRAQLAAFLSGKA